MEQITFSAPLYSAEPANTAKVALLTLDLRGGRIFVIFEGDNGQDFNVVWLDGAGENASQMMRQLNKANFSTKTLHKTIYERALADGKLAVGGTITGTPD